MKPLPDLDKLDPFTPVYRSPSAGGGGRRSGVRRFHFNRDCPAAGESPLHSRLGAMLAAKRLLCSLEGGPPNPIIRPLHQHGGRVPVAFRRTNT